MSLRRSATSRRSTTPSLCRLIAVVVANPIGELVHDPFHFVPQPFWKQARQPRNSKPLRDKLPQSMGGLGSRRL
jgi:hypothetical protein